MVEEDIEGGVPDLQGMIADELADLSLQHLQAHMQCHFLHEMQCDVGSILRRLQQLHGQGEGSANASQQQNASALRAACMWTDKEALRLANRIIDETQNLLYNHKGTARADLLRDFVIGLIGSTQCTAAQLLTLLHLLGYYLPQPFPVSDASQERVLRRGYARDVAQAIRESFHVDAHSTLEGR